MNRLVVLVGCVALAAYGTFGAVEVSSIFSDHMVLQRGKPVPVWGTAKPGEKVAVSFAGASATAIADAKGAWEAKLPALEISKEGRAFTVRGENEIVFKDVLVGDVWLITGQSNAEMRMAEVLDKDKEMATSKDYPTIRATKFAHRRALYPAKDPCNSPWTVCTAETLPGVTAIGWFFAREIVRETGIPIGILDNNWGGCCIEPYISREGFASVPELKSYSDKLEKQLADLKAGQPKQRYDAAVRELNAWQAYASERIKAGKPIEFYPYRVPADAFLAGQHNAMIAPISRLPIAGIAWYQGCSNAGEGESHVAKLQALVNGWRSFWGAETPVYIVQLSTWKDKTTDPAGGDGFARIRNGQRIAAEKIPHSALVVTIDIGADNNWDIHPKNKLDAGVRLAKPALRDVYGRKDLVASGPLYDGFAREGDSLRIRFRSCGSGLMAGDKAPHSPGIAPVPAADGKLRGFAVAGADRKWQWADARIDGATVVVSAPDVKEPVAVRYAHRMNPQGACNLYNREGLPASPFRSDNW